MSQSIRPPDPTRRQTTSISGGTSASESASTSKSTSNESHSERVASDSVTLDDGDRSRSAHGRNRKPHAGNSSAGNEIIEDTFFHDGERGLYAGSPSEFDELGGGSLPPNPRQRAVAALAVAGAVLAMVGVVSAVLSIWRPSEVVVRSARDDARHAHPGSEAEATADGEQARAIAPASRPHERDHSAPMATATPPAEAPSVAATHEDPSGQSAPADPPPRPEPSDPTGQGTDVGTVAGAAIPERTAVASPATEAPRAQAAADQQATDRSPATAIDPPATTRKAAKSNPKGTTPKSVAKGSVARNETAKPAPAKNDSASKSWAQPKNGKQPEAPKKKPVTASFLDN